MRSQGQVELSTISNGCTTRLWVAGAVSQTRDHHLADRLLIQVRACALAVGALLVATDGWAAYPKSIKRAFREKVKETAGRGRACCSLTQLIAKKDFYASKVENGEFMCQ